MGRCARALAVLVTVLVPIAAWPGAGDPFVTPRLGVLAAGIAVIGLLLVASRAPLPALGPHLRAVAPWVAVLGFSAALAPLVSLATLLQELLVLAWAGLLVWARPTDDRVATALRVAGTIVAGWAVLQWLGVDPWARAGWIPGREYGPRMRVYATLGNPNYVGAFLAAVLPIALARVLGRSPRAADLAVIAIVAAGIVATGSRGAWLGAAAGAAWLALAGAVPGRTAAVAIVAGVLVAGAGIAYGPARGLGETLRGRAYIWSVSAPHLLEHPLTGWGPGSFEVTYPGWEAERIERGVDRDVRAYATAQRHAHNDYVERLSELGVPGLLAWGGLVAWVLWAPGRLGARSPEAMPAVAAAAGVAALAAVSLVDFPMQRPVERFTWWTLAVLATTGRTAGFESRETTR